MLRYGLNLRAIVLRIPKLSRLDLPTALFKSCDKRSPPFSFPIFTELLLLLFTTLSEEYSVSLSSSLSYARARNSSEIVSKLPRIVYKKKSNGPCGVAWRENWNTIRYGRHYSCSVVQYDSNDFHSILDLTRLDSTRLDYRTVQYYLPTFVEHSPFASISQWSGTLKNLSLRFHPCRTLEEEFRYDSYRPLLPWHRKWRDGVLHGRGLLSVVYIMYNI